MSDPLMDPLTKYTEQNLLPEQAVVLWLMDLTDKAREEFVILLTQHFCIACGSLGRGCQCENDE